MNQQEFATLIETELGGNLIDVELSAPDYQWAFDRAKLTMQQRGNNNFDENYYALDVVAGTTEYNVDPAIDSVRSIIRPGTGFYSSNPFSFQIFQSLMMGVYNIGSTSLLDYEETLGFIQRVQRMTAFEISFIWNKRTHILKLLKAPPMTEKWFLHCFTNVSDDTYRDQLWIQKWAYAEALAILGRAYMKFQSIPSPAGDASLPGQDMVQESNDLKEKLLEDIDNMVDADPSGFLPIMMY